MQQSIKMEMCHWGHGDRLANLNFHVSHKLEYSGYFSFPVCHLIKGKKRNGEGSEGKNEAARQS